VANQHFPKIQQLQENIGKVLLGKPKAIRSSLVALFGGGHLLVEDAPGVGKTSLAKAIAKSLDCDFTRLQFTPDMLPSDILGASIFLPNKGEFEFREGPVFTNILLADEINRTTPRTQSALLEAMNEGQVSIEGSTYRLDPPFFVLATQNPFEFEGTYPLPENQLDRFMLRIEVGYPDREFEKQALRQHRTGEPVDVLEAVMSGEELIAIQKDVREIKVEDSINDYLLDIVTATREHPDLEVGVSTRGALTFYRALQSWAMVAGRDYVIPDDVKELATEVLAHRVQCRSVLRESQRQRAVTILEQIMQQTPIPD